ncbi:MULTISPECIES: TRAP transporter large permease [Dethiosulfovibrio]|uniref:TRAP transporter large permease n=2 Tax=Dethiosulfovibrio TaxID=47054 RepID=A0ABS9EM14_9BACT|nr:MULTISPECIES: TRAP transporter large permease [Dethiosulfovibrio]MCF4113170.1 TRAP transporter large permease [Dethiosulfovibrio russensis]MCF4142234.1 TRAP transporter large permease [Dethiosulfovibrio marinus]MCF4144542.1 TRAP transporter large permease [Dethiosulfovibrio acidaminovorans]
MTAAVLFTSLVVLFAINVPIAVSIGLSSLAAVLFSGAIPPVVVVQKMITATDSFPLMAVPFFLLAGSLMEYGGISRRLVDLANSFVGRYSGGLAFVAIVSSMFFGAISGAAVPTVAAIGSILIPAMVRKGYDKSFATAVEASAGTLGVMIPPSIPMIIYGTLTGVSIGALFMGGILPGVLVGFSLMFVAWRISRKRGYRGDARSTRTQRWTAFKEAIPALMMPIIILGGIYGGVFTPTEAAVIAVVYGFMVGTFVYKTLGFRDIRKTLVSSAVGTSVVMFIIATCSVFSWILTAEQIPQLVADAILSISDNPIVILTLVNLLLLFIGTFMETVAAIIILVPVLLPIVTQIGVDPLHFGIVMVVNLAVGMVTPPLGVCLFVGCGISGIKLEQITRAILPFILIMILDILILAYVPVISTLLPRLAGIY